MKLTGEPNHLVLTTQNATTIAITMVVLLALAFAMGFLIASVK